MWEWRVFSTQVALLDALGKKEKSCFLEMINQADRKIESRTTSGHLEVGKDNDKTQLETRTDEYFDLEVNTLGLKVRGQKRLELKIRSAKEGELEFWNKVFSAEFPIPKEQFDLIASLTYPELRGHNITYEVLSQAARAKSQRIMILTKMREMREGPNVKTEMVRIQFDSRYYYSICLESRSREALLRVGREFRLFREDGASRFVDLPNSRLMGYPEACHTIF